MIGEVFGSYRIVRLIGEGGMGAVYLAEHTLIGRHAAIKVLLREMSHRQDLVTRFFNEARAATAVKHPGIVEIYDFGYHGDGSAYIVMEYLDGESLASRLRRMGPQPEARAAALCRQVAGALGAAHSKGIVHRDLKPDNIFIVRDSDMVEGERTKILDFGIAKLNADAPGGSMTRTGMVMGTPAYMSPEQSKGAGQVDGRTDIYALGCILFELVCGRPPFVAEGTGEVMAAHILAPPPRPSSFRPVSPALEQVILRALAKAPEHRFKTTDELIGALNSAIPSGTYPRAGAATAPTVATGQHALSVPPRGPVAAAQPTTLSAATGAQTIDPPRKGRAAMWLGVCAVIGIAIGGIAFVATRNGEATQTAKAPAPEPTPKPAPTPTPTSAPAPAPAPVPAPAPAPPAKASRVTIKLDSDPKGADVYRMPQGVRIGVTPVTYPMDAIDGQVVLLVKKKGYADKEVALPANSDSEQTVKLAKTASATRSHTAPQGSSTSSGDTGTLDPFDKLGGKAKN